MSQDKIDNSQTLLFYIIIMDSSLITKDDSPLHTAVRLNQLENVKKILDQGTVDVNALNSRRETALHTMAFRSGQKDQM